jgi:hypothetical protein
MKTWPLRLGLGLCLYLMGCSTLRHNEVFPRIPEAPRLRPAQLLGLEQPDNLEQDVDSKQWAMPEVLAAFRALQREGDAFGWKIILVSGYRSYNGQRHLWNKKFKSVWEEAEMDGEHCVRSVFEYTSLPGFSRHHWGTELDLGEYHIKRRTQVPLGKERPKMEDFYAWLEVNAPRFGFCKVYKGVLGAIQEEPWHWSYRRYASEFQKQFDALGDFSSLPMNSILGWEWIRPRFSEYRQLIRDSVTDDCRLSKNVPLRFLKVEWLPEIE